MQGAEIERAFPVTSALDCVQRSQQLARCGLEQCEAATLMCTAWSGCGSLGFRNT